MGGKLRIGIVGSKGYSGQELVRLLARHEKVESVSTFNSDTVQDSLSQKLNLVFLATPPEVSLAWAPRFLENGTHVIDLSHAYRMKSEPYGLVPFAAGPLFANSAKPMLISNPGCYVTSVLMAIIPLLKAKAIDASTLVIDAKSGATGAGKKPLENLLFTEIDQECLPYRVGTHQHLPEISFYAEKFSGVAIDPFFTTSLLPFRRGIISGIYAKLTPQFQKDGLNQILNLYKQEYQNYPLATAGTIEEVKPLLKHVVGTARTHIAAQVVGEKLYLFSLIDNLMKGAATQAIENFNLFLGLPSHTSLTHLEALP